MRWYEWLGAICFGVLLAGQPLSMVWAQAEAVDTDVQADVELQDEPSETPHEEPSETTHNELNVEPSEDANVQPARPQADIAVTGGELRFNFVGEQWLDVLKWYADAADLNLDWQEVPEGQLNLITQQSYTLREALDVLNLHLLARGFTLLRGGDVLFLVKLDENINPSLVPRVAPEDLEARGRYEYCKVSLSLDWMLAERAVEELRPMLSPYGKITPLSATNRIEVMDAAVNLREIRDLLAREQSDTSQERLVEEFVLEHAVATEVIEKLRQILGLETPPSRMSRDDARMAHRQLELRAELAKRLGDKAEMKMPESDVYLVVNERKNSIMANAAPDKIAIIRQAVRSLDVPSEQGFQLADITTMKVYPLKGAEAEAVADILEELRDIGKLHASARFSEDDDRQILFAYASLEDHLTIASVMEQLAGSARSFKVIPLTRLRAAYVAQSVQTLMGGAEASNNRGDRWRRGNQSDARGFRVEADLPNNRLLLYATDVELRQIDELLVQIGERPAANGSGSSSKVRVVDATGQQTDDVINRLRAVWPAVSSNPLRIELPGQRPAQRSRPPRERVEREDSAARRGLPASDPAAYADGRPDSEVIQSVDFAIPPTAVGLFFTSLLQQPPSEDSSEDIEPIDTNDSATRGFARWERGQPDETADAPLTIRQGPNGELILMSDDLEALDQLEGVLQELLPERRPYTVFRLNHASPYAIELTLEEILTSDQVRAASPIQFVSDSATKSIMVFGAGGRELREIEELIRFYDQPAPTDPESVRKPQLFHLQHARAESVVEVLKDIYRDLLSANDRALAREEGSRGAREAAAASSMASSLQGARFKGTLSIGVYSDTNSLVVSAPAFLTAEIGETIERLDRPAPPTVTRFVTIEPGVNASLVARHLTELLASEGQQPADDQRARNDRNQARNVRDQARNDRDQGRNNREFQRRDDRPRDREGARGDQFRRAPEPGWNRQAPANR